MDETTRPDPLQGQGPPDLGGVYDPSIEEPDLDKLPLPPQSAQGEAGVPVVDPKHVPRGTRQRMARPWWDHYAPLYRAVGRGDLIPERHRRWSRRPILRAEGEGKSRKMVPTGEFEDGLSLEADGIVEVTPSLPMRKAFGDALLKMAIGELAPQSAEGGDALPPMPPLVWMVPSQQTADPAPEPGSAAAALMEMAGQMRPAKKAPPGENLTS